MFLNGSKTRVLTPWETVMLRKLLGTILGKLKVPFLSLCLGLAMIAILVLLGIGVRLGLEVTQKLTYEHPIAMLSCLVVVVVAAYYGYIVGSIFKFWE